MKNFYPFLLLLVFLVQPEVKGQDPVRIKRTTGQITFDGLPFEEAWNSLSEFKLVMHKPDYGLEPSELSNVRIGYDNEYLWISAQLFMRDASRIFTATKKRDEDVSDYDAFGILLDTYDDNESALAFFTTPTASRTDYAVANDSQGSSKDANKNISWNTFWDVKTSRDKSGWYVEMRIPFSSLKFKPEGDVTTMGLIITRIISESNEIDTYPLIDPKYGYFGTNKPSLAQTIEFVGAKPKMPVFISPYALAGFSRNCDLNDTETEFVRKDNPDFNAGMDVKYNINSNLTLDLTANTDFAQVEADDQKINLTRYSLSFPEKRMFFQERASLFDFSLEDREDNLFYSRNIGISNREFVRILGGARLTGKIGGWNIGLLDMQTARNDDLPGENFGVLRMRRQVINSNSYVGGIFTSRLSMNNDRNFAYGLDGIFRLYGDDYLTVKWAQTYDSETGNPMNSLDPSFMVFKWERRSEKGFSYNLKYSYKGKEFDPGIGYIKKPGLQGPSINLLYGVFPGGKSRIFSYLFSVRGERYMRLSDGLLESALLSSEIKVKGRNGIRGTLSVDTQKEGVIEDFRLSDSITVLAGVYNFTSGNLEVETPNSKKIAIGSKISAGQFYDGSMAGIEIESEFNVSSSFRLSAMYKFDGLRFPGREINNSLDIHSVNMKALYMLNTKLSASVLLQYVNTYDEMISNFRLRYNPREGNDFYLVFNELRGLYYRNIDATPPPFLNRTIIIKYTHTFIL